MPNSPCRIAPKHIYRYVDRVFKVPQPVDSPPATFSYHNVPELLTDPTKDANLLKLKSRSHFRPVPLFLLLMLGTAAIAQSVSPELFNGLKWRLIGPFR